MVSTPEEAIATLQNESLSENEREAAIHFLQHNPTEAGTTALVVGLRDSDPGVRWACSTALSDLGEQALVPLLRGIGSTDNDPLLREGALHVLAHSSSPVVRTKTKDLQKALKGPGAQLASMEEAANLMMQG